MPVTYTLIASNVLSTTAASVTFSAIPATYTDLVLRLSTRTNRTSANLQRLFMKFNGDGTTTKYSFTDVSRSGTSPASFRLANTEEIWNGYTQATDSTSNTFANTEIYIPNYASSVNKPLSAFACPEDNVSGYMDGAVTAVAGLYSETAAITSVTFLLPTGSFVSGSSFYLYGIKNS
jgi:hypothetical protein